MQSLHGIAPSRVLPASCCIAILLAACSFTIKLSRATDAILDGSKETLANAIRIVPDDANLLTSYAEVSGQEEAERALQRAVSLNPGAWSGWTQLGLSAEAGNDFQQAEFFYRQAARANRQFQPSWTLANYFFRRGDQKEFVTWAAQSLRMTYGDPRPLFDLCWRADPNPGMVLQAIQDRGKTLRLYLAYLTSEGRLEAAEEVAQRLLSLAGAADTPTLVAYCDRLLGAGTAPRAVAVWNALCRRRLLPHGALAPEEGRSLTNGDFAAAPSSLGFDWRVIPWTGVSVAHLPGLSCLRINFSGTQPESCEILNQFLPVLPGKVYQLNYEYRTPEFEPEPGLSWRVYDAAKGVELTETPPQISSRAWGRQVTRFSTGPECRLARLVLVYQKAPGSTRAEGSLWLRQIELH